MGFECHYSYHEKVDGEYNKDEVKILKKKVGDPFEDVPLEKLAVSVMAQLARRDIWIVDVSIFELSKKSVSFKEAKGGIVLKNRKFLFDDGDNIKSIIVEEPQVENSYVPVITNGNHVNIAGESKHPHNSISLNQTSQTNQASLTDLANRRPIGHLIFSPEPQQMAEIKQKNLRFTVDNKYPIYERKSSPIGGDVLLLIDDVGRQQMVSDKFFVPIPQLFADNELGFSENQQQRDGGKLFWGNANVDPGMPDIRRR